MILLSRHSPIVKIQMKTQRSNISALNKSLRSYSKATLLCACFFASIVSAQVDLSPNGRIDILNDQKEQEENSKKDLIFKNSGPLKDVIAKQVYIPGEKVCQAEISTSYFQAANQAKVEAEIDHSECGASNGKYTVVLKTQDEAGEIHTTKHKEVWSRTGTDAVKVKLSYPMSQNMELLKARIKLPSREYCTCLEEQD